MTSPCFQMSFQNNHRAVELEDSPGRKAPGKISRSSCSWAKGAWMSLSNTQSSRILQTSDDGGSTSTPGEAVAGIDCSHSKILLFYTKMKPFPVQLVPVALSLFHVAPWEGSAPVLFAATLLSTGALCLRSHWNLLQGEQT